MSYDDIATLGFKAETSDLEKAANALDKMSVAADKTDSAVKKAESSMQSTSSASARLNRDITDLVSAAQAAAAAFAAWRITKLGEDALLAAARFQTLGVVMEVAGRNAGYTADQMHTFERDLNANGIAMKESRETLTRLAAAHVNLADSAKLARAAQDLAVAGDVNSSEAFARMTQGIQKAETEIMRSLGLNIQWEQGYQKLARSVGVATSALSEQQKTQARVNQTLEAAAAYAELYDSAMTTAGKQLTSMPRYLQNISILAGSIGLPAFSSSILAATEGLKSLEAALQSLTNDGTIAKWGVELDSSLKTVVSGVDNVLVAFALYKAAQAGIALATSVSSGAIGLQIALFRMEALTAGAAAGALRGLGTAMMSLATNPVFALVALGSVLYALWEKMAADNKEAEELQAHFKDIAAGAEGAAKATTQFVDAQAALNRELAARAVEEAAQRVEKYGTKLKDMAASFKPEMREAPSVSDGLEQDYMTEIPKEVLEAISEYNSGMRDAENLLVRLLELKNQGVSVDDAATTKLMELIQAYLASNDLLDKKNQKLKAVTDSTKGLSEAEAEAKRTHDAWGETLDAINKGLNKYNEAMKLPSSVEEATVFLLKYTGQSKLAEQAMKDLARTQANAAIETLQHAAALALFNGDAAKTVEILAVVDNFKKYLNEDGSIISPKSGAGSASAIDKVTEATLKLNEELAKVKGTNAIAAYDDIAKKIHDLEKDLGKANPQVKELNQLLVQKADYDLLQDILKHTDPVAAGIASVAKEYKDLLKNIDAAHSKGLISDDEAASMTKKAEGWKKAQEIDQQNSLLTQQLDLVQKIVDLGGSSNLAVKLQTQQIDAMAEKIRALFPEVSSLVDEWQKLAKKEINSPEAAIKRQIDALHKNRDAWSGVQAAALQYNLDATNYCQQTENIFRNTMDGLADALTEFVMTGKLSFEDLANEFIKQVIRMQMQAAVSGIFSGITGLIGGGAGAPATASAVQEVYIPDAMSVAPVSGFHDGGMVGVDTPTFTRSVPAESFIGAPRFHTGGGLFGHDEYAAILKKRELVLNEQEAQDYLTGRSQGAPLANMHGAVSPAASAPTITNNIQIVPPDGYTASESRSNNGGGGENIRITFSKMMAAEAASYGSPLNNALRRQGMKTPVVRQG